MNAAVLIRSTLLILSSFFVFNMPLAHAGNSRSLLADSGFGNEHGSGGDEILSADEAFRFSVDRKDANTLVARWRIANKHYLYRHKFKFKIKSGEGVEIGKVILPMGESKIDRMLGKVRVFHNTVEATIPLTRSTDKAVNIQIQFRYQGGDEEIGIVYPPIEKTISFDLPAAI